MSASPNEAPRALFGDLPMGAWPAGDDAGGERWHGFIRARPVFTAALVRLVGAMAL